MEWTAMTLGKKAGSNVVKNKKGRPRLHHAPPPFPPK